MAASSLTPRVALYARVSTSNHNQDPETQLAELREYCQRRAWNIVGEYVDRGVSGTREKRPELDRLMADAHRRRFDVVAVWRFDRFARSVSHLLRALEFFNALGIAFVSLSEAIDTSTPAGKMVFTVLGAVAELERSLIVERIRAGLKHARSKGRKLGRPAVAVNAKTLEHVQHARAAGKSFRAIAAETGISPRSLGRLLTNRCGKIVSAADGVSA